MDIVTCIDNKFVMPTGVMIYSVCVNNAQGAVTFHIVIDESVTLDNQRKLKEVVTPFANQLFFYKIDSTPFKKYPSLSKNKRITQATYYRLYLTETLPQSLNKVIYLDGDIIVRGSLEELWNTNLERCSIAAVNHPEFIVSDFYSRLGYPSESGYFNAGVLLINLEKWRKTNIVERFIDFIRSHPESLLAHDQDVLNYVFKNDKIALPYKYNLMSCFLYQRLENDKFYYEGIKEAISNPTIVHFLLDKPWWVYNRHLHPYRSTFFNYRNQTIWKDEPMWENRSFYIRTRKRIATNLRHLGLLPELPSDGCEYMDLPPID